jgi:hypothetical protein
LIKSAIEAGELVAGAELVERQNLQIKWNGLKHIAA